MCESDKGPAVPEWAAGCSGVVNNVQTQHSYSILGLFLGGFFLHSNPLASHGFFPLFPIYKGNGCEVPPSRLWLYTVHVAKPTDDTEIVKILNDTIVEVSPLFFTLSPRQQKRVGSNELEFGLGKW